MHPEVFLESLEIYKWAVLILRYIMNAYDRGSVLGRGKGLFL
jgi:hypothetical protein